MAEVIKSVRRVAEVLEEFDRVRKPLGLKQICVALGCAPSSGAAVLKSLVTLGYLGYDRRTRTYLPTMRIAVFGEWLPQELFGRFDILPTLEELCRVSGMHAFLATQSDLYAQYVHVIASEREGQQINAKPGMLLPIARSSVGRLLLSTQSDEELDKLIRRVNFFEPRLELRIDLASLMPTLRAIRDQGYIFTRNLLTDGVGVIAMQIPASIFDRTLAIGFGGELEELERDPRHYVELLKEAVATISAAAAAAGSRSSANNG